MATKKLKLLSKLFDNFASCHAAVLKLHKVLLFCFLIDNVGNYDSLLLYCGQGGISGVVVITLKPLKAQKHILCSLLTPYFTCFPRYLT